MQILRKQTKTSVHDVQNVQNNLSGTGVRRPPGRLHFPECAGYEKTEIQSLLKDVPSDITFSLCI
ncbi:hypothetical protein COO29_26270 [Escherichia coli]|uniref:Uncharacterized protein n=1 Tax=Escherichia coli TaxID=562 RepID=A0A7B7AIR2_ECOLX|nr:hypothetical protein AM468_16265 [Escherichia coli]AZH86707.1 hypothetical protein CHQ92_08550 [Escherichia coli]EEW2639502.1 hypothetical protein [Escherichia coli]EEY3909695.1 hypothetical protein [Escherichia coli]EFC1453217.1 hypothetical protein [Escherichia coli]